MELRHVGRKCHQSRLQRGLTYPDGMCFYPPANNAEPIDRYLLKPPAVNPSLSGTRVLVMSCYLAQIWMDGETPAHTR